MIVRGAFSRAASLMQVLTDRGTQFYANKRDKNGFADSRFENFLEKNKIKHIKTRVNSMAIGRSSFHPGGLDHMQSLQAHWFEKGSPEER
jgi:hypothetical protein